MKRILSIMTLMLLFVASLSAQSLVGTWKTVMQDEDQKMDLFFTFSATSNIKVAINVPFSDPQVGTFTFVATMTGTYKRNGDKLKLNIDPKNVTVQLENIKFSAEMEAIFKDQPDFKKEINKMLKEQMESSKKDLVSDVPLDDTMVILSLTANTLELRSEEGEDVHTFTKVVQKKASSK